MELPLSIAEVSRRTGLSAHTLRYYERIGLIAPVARAPGGQRSYAAQDLDWIGFLLRLRATGMPISGMQVFARLRSEGNTTAGERRQMLEQHLAWLLETMAALQQSVSVLQAKIEHYRGVERALSQTTALHERQFHDNDSGNNDTGKRPTLPARARQSARDRR
jgi:DNA-binding transcriptional MerR regulator